MSGTAIAMRFTHYVSPTGTSSGPGSQANPWQTIDQAIAAVPTTAFALGGATGTIILTGSASSPNTYVSTAGITVSGTLTIKAQNAGGAIVAGNGTTEAILLATGANLTLQDLIVGSFSEQRWRGSKWRHGACYR